MRRLAEERLAERRPAARPPPGEADARRLVHELQVHQIELEMQNAELREARGQMEACLEKYTALYDFAPVAYFSLDRAGRILGVNLTGAALLGAERGRLVNGSLLPWLAPASRPVFLSCLARLVSGREKQACELLFLQKGARPLWASLCGVPAPSVGPRQTWCQVAVSDITAFKQAGEAQRRVGDLESANQELRREIRQRMAAGQALREAEHRQSQMLAESRRLQEQLQQLSHQTLRAQEDERKRISREIHDGIIQDLLGIDLCLHDSLREWAAKRPEAELKIARTQRLVRGAMDMMRQFAHELRPATLDDVGLLAALRGFIDDFKERTGLRVRLTAVAGLERLDTPRRTALYRVCQSALGNVEQHACATQVRVSLGKVRGGVRLIVADDGKSFEVDRVLHAGNNQRLGLVGMRERLEMVGGSLGIESSPGHGTTIRALVPFPEQASEPEVPPGTAKAKPGGRPS